MSFVQSPLYIVDMEFSDIDPLNQEIIEIGAVRVHQETMEVLGQFETKISPQHVETANPDSLRISGYNAQDWEGAPAIEQALEHFGTFITEKDALYGGWNIALDWTFLLMAYKQAGIKNPFDFHLFDVRAVAAEFLKAENNIDRITLNSVSYYFQLEKRPVPHRALDDARQAYKVLKRIRELTKVPA